MKKTIGILVIIVLVALSLYLYNNRYVNTNDNLTNEINQVEETNEVNETEENKVHEEIFKDEKELQHLTIEDFDFEIKKYDKVIVELYTNWCTTCQKKATMLKEFADENTDTIKVFVVNCEVERALKERYGVDHYPTILAFKNGEKINKLVGYNSKEDILALFKN